MRALPDKHCKGCSRMGPLTHASTIYLTNNGIGCSRMGPSLMRALRDKHCKGCSRMGPSLMQALPDRLYICIPLEKREGGLYITP